MKNIVSSLPSPGAAPTVLVIDQQRNLPEAVFAALDQGGYAVRRYRNARQALREFGREPADLVLVDLPLPDDGAGLGVLAELRQLSAVPVVLLARQPRLDDITDSFLLGADDYIQIPIDPARLIERLARHAPPAAAGSVTAGCLRLWPERHLLEMPGQTLGLTEIESRLLGRLMATPGQPVSTADLSQSAWPADEASARQALHKVETAAMQLQSKIGSHAQSAADIVRVPGGYQLQTAPARSDWQSNGSNTPHVTQP